MTRAIETPHVSPPPKEEIEWTFSLRKQPGVQVRVHARSWFAARDLAAMKLGISRDEVELAR